GPDADGAWRDDGCGLGHTRLSIIDLSPAGAQPMASPDGRYVVVFNGEIYNFLELREELEARGESFAGHSDTEVLLRLFVRDGLEGCLARLRGMFAFAVWDRQQQELALARDRVGVKPLVYAETAEGFLFGSEIRALLALQPALPRRADWAAIDHYLTYQYIPAPLTGFAAIRKLPPGHLMKVRGGKIVSLARYWDIDPGAATTTANFAESCEQLREQVLEATRLRMVSDVPLGAFLSGGIDSSVVVAAMCRLSADPIKTYAIGFEDEKFNELPYARQVAAHLGTDHHELTVRPDAAAIVPQLVEHFGEPHADSSAIPTYYVSQLARRGVTVALTGDGGDEAFAGYRRFYHASLAQRLSDSGLLPAWRLARRATTALEGMGRKQGPAFPHTRADQGLYLPPAQRYEHLIAYFTRAEKQALVTPRFRERAGDVDTSALVGQWLERAGGADRINRHLYVDLHTYLPEDVLPKVDICSMMNSLECRSPFLDHRLLEFAMRLPGHYKMAWPHRHKHNLKEAFKDWLPPGFMERGKMGFSIPLARWLRGDLADLVRERLLAEQTLAPWINVAPVQRQVEEHLSGQASHSKRLWALLILAEWMKVFGIEA
ncbi:MAG TPA: asparagine synthase (glutamine-hydrolyzing), partial [Rhodocyclaceae bacterium]